jgi:hypothetical protein
MTDGLQNIIQRKSSNSPRTFFPDASYPLIGYCLIEKTGFLHTRNHDYYNPDLGIIPEDLHDENVLTQEGVLFFIDTVFYIKS